MTILVTLLVAAAMWLTIRPDGGHRLLTVLPRRTAQAANAGRRPLTWLATMVSGAAVFFVVGGVLGLVVGGMCAALMHRLVGRMESRAARTHRQALERQAPDLADLLAATLAAGVPLAKALDAVAVATGEPTAGVLGPVVAAMALGAEPGQAWPRECSVLEPIRAAVVRSTETGAPLSVMLANVASDLRRERRATVEVAARSAGVRAVAPLVACFLPAFILLGVVPVVASLAGALLTG